ncbi:hypothetical protein OAX78_04000 [Planctomycetota bacterium]|nr:hypothetical protein [Planctomycetota bacterium]
MRISNLKKNINRRRRQGQGMTEYIIIVGLIAILLIGAVTTFKDKLAETYQGAGNKIDTEITQKIQ